MHYLYYFDFNFTINQDNLNKIKPLKKPWMAWKCEQIIIIIVLVITNK